MNHIQPLQFTANARLKDIIGRGLIYDDNIAILELVKNSKDAGSPKVSIEFEKCDQWEGGTKLIISDIGHGMSLDDIKDKWLNIAYSEKRDVRRQRGGFFAGNKGIGRFSCDRLGNTLDLYTRTKGDDYIALHIKWDEYEVNDLSTQIGDIDVQTRTLSTREFEFETGKRDISHGTVMVIRHLSAKWTKEKLLALRKELERLSIDTDNQFEISLSHWKYRSEDPVNQPIENKVFSDLDFRTTSVSATIGDDGKYIHLELRHDGDYIFKLQEKNPYSELRDVEAKIYFLNKTAKSFFKRRTGYRLEEYGSIQLFLNGFRISPYGSQGNDWLGINSRENGDQRRSIKTRDIVGFVKVIDTKGVFETVSSREGLVNNRGFEQLTSCASKNARECGLIYKLIYKLEMFVKDGLDWDQFISSKNEMENTKLPENMKYETMSRSIMKSIAPVMRYMSNEDNLRSIDLNIDYINTLASKESDDYRNQIADFTEKLEGLSVGKMLDSERQDVTKLINRIARELGDKEKHLTKLKSKHADVERKLEAEKSKRMFAERHYSKDNEKLAQINHEIGLLAESSIQRLDRICRRYGEDESRYSKEDLKETLDELNLIFKKINSTTTLALKANFDLTRNRVNEDIIQFIQEYLDSFRSIINGFNLKVTVNNVNKTKKLLWFKPVELTILVDNLLVNSARAKATKVDINIIQENGKTKIFFIDDGIGLTDRFCADDLFSNGVTTTRGSGIGLNQVKHIMEEMNGTVTIRNGSPQGAIVELELGK